MSLLKMLTRILAIVGKELVSVIRRPGALISLVLGPFLIMALFGAGFSGYRRPLDAILVIPPQTGLSTDPQVYQDVREAMVSGYPYSAYYREEPGQVVVLSVFHTARDPSIWQSRV